ncbi:hypothetical protein J6590_037393 [Homalodisca vitripennis]|nr:hypothetical protein J6590_037393 [Homalodisca vitripennis]
MNSRLPAKTNPLGSTEEGTETRGLEMIRYSPPYGLNIPPSTMMGDHLLRCLLLAFLPACLQMSDQLFSLADVKYSCPSSLSLSISILVVSPALSFRPVYFSKHVYRTRLL